MDNSGVTEHEYENFLLHSIGTEHWSFKLKTFQLQLTSENSFSVLYLTILDVVGVAEFS
jgi:hypothetical protein